MAAAANRLPVAKTYKIFIGGKFPRTESGRYFALEDKKGAVIANMCRGSRKDFRNSVVAARQAQAGWAGASAYLRGQILYRIAEMLEGRKEQFVAELVLQGNARRAAERALEIEPEAAAPRLLLARAMLETGDPERALQLIEELESLARQHAAEAQTSDYARDLLVIDPALVRQVRAGIGAARQAQAQDPRFGPEDQEDKAGSSRPLD